jgi:hypothetical protein
MAFSSVLALTLVLAGAADKACLQLYDWMMKEREPRV